MKAKTITILFVTAILTFIWSSAVWADRSNRRDYRQEQRIRQGFRSNEITRPEVLRLRTEQRRIDRAYGLASADGNLNRRERQHFNNMQNRASRHIYRAKHNQARRNLHRYYRKSAHREIRHGHFVLRHRNANSYSPRIRAGYAFSVGVSNIGWQFAFSGRDIR